MRELQGRRTAILFYYVIFIINIKIIFIPTISINIINIDILILVIIIVIINIIIVICMLTYCYIEDLLARPSPTARSTRSTMLSRSIIYVILMVAHGK